MILEWFHMNNTKDINAREGGLQPYTFKFKKFSPAATNHKDHKNYYRNFVKNFKFKQQRRMYLKLFAITLNCLETKVRVKLNTSRDGIRENGEMSLL